MNSLVSNALKMENMPDEDIYVKTYEGTVNYYIQVFFYIAVILKKNIDTYIQEWY